MENLLRWLLRRRFTPSISRDGRVLMKVKPEVSSGRINPTTGLPDSDTTEVE